MSANDDRTSIQSLHANLELLEGQWIGHVTGLPGCFGSEMDRVSCTSALPGAIEAHRRWLRDHGVETDDGEAVVEVDEIVRGWQVAESVEVNAFFATDRAPLTAGEIATALLLLGWTRADLIAEVADLLEAERSRDLEDGWSIDQILLHVGGAEWWYLEQLGLATARKDVPDEPFARLEQVRARLIDVLPSLAGDDRLTAPRLEVWSPRKMLRRALWHERDHTSHIHRLRWLLQ